MQPICMPIKLAFFKAELYSILGGFKAMTEKFCSIKVHQWIKEESQYLVFALHGFTGSGLDFYPLVEVTFDKFDWVCPDILEADSLEKTLEQLNQILQKFQNKKIILLGYSMGGRVLLHYVLRYPDCCSAFDFNRASPGIENETERKKRREADLKLAEKILKIGTKKFIDEWQQTPLIKSQKKIDPKIYNKMLQRKDKLSEVNLANSLKFLGTGKLSSLWHRLHEIKQPVFLFTGEKDLKFSQIAQKMCRQMLNARHIVISQAGHAAHLENMGFFIGRIIKLL